MSKFRFSPRSFGLKKKLIGTHLLTAGFISKVNAQFDQIEIPDDFIKTDDICDIVNVTVNPDGSVSLTTLSGETYTIAASEVVVTSLGVFVSTDAVEAIGCAVEGTGVLPAALLVGAAAGGVGLGLSGSSDSDSPGPTPPPSSAPVFTSLATASVAENQTGALRQ